ncbi:hypothetical protein WAI453_011325 [Rhynchosporium graminicola]
MSDPPSYDQHLLDRLNALRKSSVELDPNSSKSGIKSSPTSTPETNLSDRLRSLRNGTPSSPSPSPLPAPNLATSSITSFPSSSSAANHEEDSDPLRTNTFTNDEERTLDELLADLGPDDQWTLYPDDPEDIQKLLDEARGALPRDEEGKSELHNAKQEEGGDSDEKGRGKNEQYLSRDLDMSAFALENEEDEEKEKGKVNLERESREAQDIVQRMLDEVNLEKAHDPKDTDDEDAPLPKKSQKQSDEERNSPLSLPSAPSNAPQPTRKQSLDFESDISARLAALSAPSTSTDSLGLPSAPRFKPIDKPLKSVMKKKNYTDEEVDTWCIICQDDATVKCLGCDGDLYCAGCWKEGHMGPDVGFEEKVHKWLKYRKPN